jgi:TolA-binding protein
MGSKRTNEQMDGLSQYLAMENGAVTRKMKKMEEEHEQELKFQIALNLQTDAQLQESTGRIEELEDRLDQQEETMALARIRLTEQNKRLLQYKSQYDRDSMEILKMTRALGHLRVINRNLAEQLRNAMENKGETTEED